MSRNLEWFFFFLFLVLDASWQSKEVRKPLPTNREKLERTGFFCTCGFASCLRDPKLKPKNYRKYPRIMLTFSTKILTSKLGVPLYVGIFVYTWVCWKIPHLWFKSWGVHYMWVHFYVGIYGILGVDLSLLHKKRLFHKSGACWNLFFYDNENISVSFSCVHKVENINTWNCRPSAKKIENVAQKQDNLKCGGDSVQEVFFFRNFCFCGVNTWDSSSSSGINLRKTLHKDLFSHVILLWLLFFSLHENCAQ